MSHVDPRRRGGKVSDKQRTVLVPAAIAGTAFIAVGVALRVAVYTRAILPDELANLTVRPWYRVVFSAESAINPPLLRGLINALFSDAWAPYAGRALGVACSVLSLAAAAALARRLAGGGALAGWLAASALAISPVNVLVAATFRSYPAAGLFALLFAGALVAWLEGPPERRPTAVALTGAVLCWLHYLWVPPVLGVLVWAAWRSPDHRRGAVLSALTVLAALSPMIPGVLHGSSAAVLPDRPWVDLAQVAAIGAWTPDAIVDAVGLPDRSPVIRSLVPATLVLAVLFDQAMEAWRAPPPRAAVPMIITLLALTVTGSAHLQVVRSPVASFLAALLVPVAAASLARMTTWRRPAVFAAALAWVLVMVPSLVDELATDTHTGMPTFASTWHRFDDVRGDRPIRTAPSYAQGMLHWTMTGQSFGSYEPPPACDGLRSCFVRDDVVFAELDEHEPLPNALVVRFDDRDDPRLQACARVYEQPLAMRVYDCR